MTRWTGLWIAVALLCAACTSPAQDPPDDSADATETGQSDRGDTTDHAFDAEAAGPAPTETATSTATSATVVTSDPTPQPTAIPESTREPLPLPAGFGRYLVAKPGAGDHWFGEPGDPSDHPARIIPVYDEPHGPKRMLVESNEIDGIEYPMPLYNWTANGSPTVLRVTAGLEGDAFVQVQAPTRPHDRTVWVKAADFEWADTTRRIEIDLAGPGELKVFDGAEIMLRAPIVQGRDHRPTPVHVTYLAEGTLTRVSEHHRVYGDAIVRMASFSEVLGSFGGGGSPENFLHGTDAPELMGQRVSSGEIRLTNEDLQRAIELVHPGTPIIMFDSSAERPGRDEVLARVALPAQTTPLVTNAVGTSATRRTHPQLWIPCTEPARVCPHPEPHRTERSFRYAIVADPDREAQILVFDEPDGAPRTPVDTNRIDGVQTPAPLYPRNYFGEPLVLRVLAVDSDWLKVQLPVRPNHSHAWVHASDFEVRETDVFIEIALAEVPPNGDPGGELLLYDRDELLLRTLIVSGRESRPTPRPASGWVRFALDNADDRIGPAYGSRLIAIGLFSETLGTFGGGGAPGIAIHGTNQPDLIGQRVSSGNARVTNEQALLIGSTPGILGAPVFIHDERPYLSHDLASLHLVISQPANTIPFLPDAEEYVIVAG